MAEIHKRIREVYDGRSEALHRKKIYTVLASIFLQHSDQTFTQNLLSLNFKGEINKYHEDNSDIFLGMTLIQNYNYLNKVFPLDKAQEKLTVDKNCLISGIPTQNTIKPPYEFIYTNRCSEDVIKEVMSFYEETGMEINEEIHNAPDYIGLELNFMAELCAEEVLSLSRDYSLETVFEVVIVRLLQKAFLQNHISKWVPPFADELIKDAQTDFFKGVGFLLKGYIRQECSRFGLS